MRAVRLVLSAAVLAAALVPAAASAGNQCKVWWPEGQTPTVVC